jgi:excisionase family DNA binding protein
MFTGAHQQTTIVDADQWLTVEQAAERAICHQQTIRRLIQAGLLRHARVGAGRKIIRIRASWLDNCLEACATPLETR